MDDVSTRRFFDGRLGLASVALIARQWWLLGVGALLVGCFAFLVSWFQSPMYRSSATLYVTSGSDANSQTAYQGSLASQQRVASYAKLATSDAVVRAALENSRVDVSDAEAKSLIEATTTPDTVLLAVSAAGATPDEAADLVNGVANAMTVYVADLERPTGGGQPLAKLTVVTPGSAEPTPISPKLYRNTLLGLFVGAFLGLIWVLAKSRLDTRIRSDADISQIVDVPALVSIPCDAAIMSSPLLDFSSGASPSAEAYRKLRTSLAFLRVDAPICRLLVTSPQAGEGKTTTSLNIGAAVAESGRRVVIVDGDLRRPMLARRLGLNESIGFTDFLQGTSDLADLVQPTGVAGLDVLSSGALPPNPAELLGSQRARSCISKLAAAYDFVVIDSPPVLPVTDAAVLSQWVDGVLVVARASQTRRAALVDAVEELNASHADVLGVVLNDVSEMSRPYRYGYYSSNSGDGVESSPARGDRDVSPLV